MTDPTTLRSLNDRHIMLVEDEYMIAADMQQALTGLGSIVVGPASCVADALALLEESHVELAVLDVNLSGEPVWPVADALQARGVPFVFTTGYDSSALPHRYAGVPRCEKPVNMHKVSSALLSL